MSVFVFGSNEAGIHGAGAAAYAVERHGAQYGIGNGLVGNSYAIPTKSYHILTLPLSKIKEYVDEFIEFANENADLVFDVTQIGWGLAGFTPAEIAPLFSKAPKNCRFSTAWSSYLPKHKTWTNA